MASTYSTNLALELIGNNDQAGSWGNTTNNNLGVLIEQAISGYVTQAVATGTDTTITIPNGATGVARNMYIELTGTGGTNTNLIVPANKKLYFIFNNSTGAVTVKVSGQTGVSVPAGAKMSLVCNGTDVVTAVSHFSALSVGSINISGITSTPAGIFMHSPATDTLAWGVGGSERMRLTSAGNIGIGTSSPVAKLAVQDAATPKIALQVGAQERAFLSYTESNFTTRLDSDGPLVFATNNAEVGRFNVSGNLGIGTASPAAKIHAINATPNSGRPTMLLDANYGNSGDTVAGLRVTLNANTGGTYLWGYTTESVLAHNMEFISGSNNVARATTASYLQQTGGAFVFYSNQSLTAGNTFTPTERMRLDTSGNLGIGTSSPTRKLEVSTAGNNYIASVNTSGSTSALLIGAESGQTRIYSWTTPTGSTGVPMAFYTGASEAMRLDTSGNLGIGATAPLYRFHSQVDSYGVTGYFLSNDGTRNPRLVFYGSSSGSTIQHTFTTGADALIFAIGGAIGSGTERMRLDVSGNLGIGTSSPGARLHLSDTSSSNYIRIDNTNGTFYAGVKSTGESYVSAESNDPLTFATNGIERARIDTSGKLGIGTTAPGALLDIAGGMFITPIDNYLSNTTALLIGRTTGNGSGIFAEAGHLVLQPRSSVGRSIIFATGSTTASERARIDSSGRLGIGTTAPKAILQSTGAAPTSVPTGGSATGAAQYLTNSNELYGMLFGIASNGVGWIQQQRTDATNTQYALLLNPIGGDVGIGTSSPSVRLHTKSSAAENVRIEGTTARGSGSVYASFYDPTGRKGYMGYAGSVTDDFFLVNEMNAAMVFLTNNTERARITAAGNIVAGASAALATTATNGFLYVPTCAGTPTGTPTAITGMAPIVVNTTNNKLYFYSGGAWRDAGP